VIQAARIFTSASERGGSFFGISGSGPETRSRISSKEAWARAEGAEERSKLPFFTFAS